MASTVISDDNLAREVEHRMLGHMTQAGMFGTGNHSIRRRGRPNALYAENFLRALEYIDENLQSALELDDLCLATGVPSRTLRRMFERHVGVSPGKYILVRKLNASRRELERAAPSEVTVSTVALKYHINHLGRSSAFYHRLSQEYPRETLSRNKTTR